MTATDFESVPIIDLSNIDSPDLKKRQELADQIDKACTGVGFFYIKNHGIPEDLIKRAYGAAHRFFALSDEQKMAYCQGKSKHFRGHTPLFGEKTTKPELEGPDVDASLGSLSEAFDVGYELAGDLRKTPNDQPPKDEFGLHGPNQWPDESVLPGFKATYLEYYSHALELARSLTRIFALALGQDEGFFDSAVKYPGAASRIIHYPPQPVPGKQLPGLTAHTDYECFTIPSQDHVPALQVLNNDGKWVLVPPIPGTLIVSISDCFAFWTNNRFSTIHRVANLSGEERYSIPLFFVIDYDATISALGSLVEDGERPVREPFSVGEYIRSKLSQAYINYGDEPVKKEVAA